MRTRMILGELPWKGGLINLGSNEIPEHIQAIEKVFLDLFARYKPARSMEILGTFGYLPYVFNHTPEDSEVQKLFHQFDEALKKAERPGAAFYEQTPDADEIAKVRFLQPYYYCDYVTSELGQANAGLVTCERCKGPNLKLLPDPLLVNKKVLKSYDLFHAEESFLVVRKRVLELLHNVAGGQFIHGNVVVAKTKEQPSGDNQLFWIRPKAELGARVLRTSRSRTCEACGRTITFPVGGMDDQINQLGPGLVDGRTRVKSFGAGQPEMAVFGQYDSWPVIVMSGALLTFLKENSVKGITIQSKDLRPQCVFSFADEPALRTEPATFGPGKGQAAGKKKSPGKEARKLTSSLKSVPWDFTEEGYVHFHLSTPEFVVLDPMTAEDTGSPYRVPNFKGPGVYKLPVTAIKRADADGVAVDSATLMFVDNAFLSDLLDEFEWEKSSLLSAPDWAYCQRVAEKIGTRFGICTVPPKKYKSSFQGDGFYKIDPKKVEPVDP